MAKAKYGYDILIKLYEYLEQNPYARYDEIEAFFLPQKISANSLVKRLQRMGCVEVEKEFDAVSGKVRGSRKTCKRKP